MVSYCPNATHKLAVTEAKERVTSRTQGSGAQDVSGFSHSMLQMQTMNRHAVSKPATSVNHIETEDQCGSDGGTWGAG